jgi:hypothetical protein
MGIIGYKAFNVDLTNRYGEKFEVNKTYSTSGPISFGNKGNGFHFCKNIEDTLRYFDAVESEVVIAEVIGTNDIVTAEDEYNGYYDMYCARTIKIHRIIERKELVQMFLLRITSEPRVSRFIQLFKLTEEELEMFKLRYASSIQIMDAIAYYQEGKKDVYEKRNKVKEKS